jgi:hypothetical protein
VHLASQLVAAVDDAVGVVVAVVDQLLSGAADFVATIGVNRQIGLEGVVLLEQALHRRHVLAQVRHSQQLLLLGNPTNREQPFVKEASSAFT